MGFALISLSRQFPSAPPLPILQQLWSPSPGRGTPGRAVPGSGGAGSGYECPPARRRHPSCCLALVLLNPPEEKLRCQQPTRFAGRERERDFMSMPCPGAPQGLGDPETLGAQGERQRRLWGSSWAKAVSINVFSGGGCSLWSLSSGVRWAPERPQRASGGSGVLVKVSVSGGAAGHRSTGSVGTAAA